MLALLSASLAGDVSLEQTQQRLGACRPARRPTDRNRETTPAGNRPNLQAWAAPHRHPVPIVTTRVVSSRVIKGRARTMASSQRPLLRVIALLALAAALASAVQLKQRRWVATHDSAARTGSYRSWTGRAHALRATLTRAPGAGAPAEQADISESVTPDDGRDHEWDTDDGGTAVILSNDNDVRQSWVDLEVRASHCAIEAHGSAGPQADSGGSGEASRAS
jgi:hypothetical protein